MTKATPIKIKRRSLLRLRPPPKVERRYKLNTDKTHEKNLDIIAPQKFLGRFRGCGIRARADDCKCTIGRLIMPLTLKQMQISQQSTWNSEPEN